MKNFKGKKTLISAMLCCVMCAGMFSMTAFAEDGFVEDPESSDIIYEEPTDPPYEETEPDEYTEPPYTEPDYEEPTYDDTDSDSSYDNYDNSSDIGYTDGNSDYSVDDSSNVDNSSSGNDYDNYTDYQYETEYYFDPADDVDENASYNDYSSSQVDLFKSDSKIDTNTLDDDDWSKIVLSLQSASGSDDGDDFSAIQNNTVKGDTGQWYLYMGIILVVVSVFGFAYAFISWQKQRKAYAAAGAKGRKPAETGGKSSVRHSSDKRDKSNYGDSYSTSSRKRRDKQDTAEIDLPRNNDNSKGRHFK